jgi:1-pyrroline-5-carboxylate dehydrogenase
MVAREATPMAGFRVTYATLTADDGELHASYDAAIGTARAALGATHPLRIGTEDRRGVDTYETRSPVDREVVVGRFAVGTPHDMTDAIDAALDAAPAWAATPWRERVEILDRAADLISTRCVEYAATMAWEVGKTRLEALGDVEESADLIRYYTHAMVEHEGFEVPMERLAQDDATYDVMRPYGVWGVISPFNYPMALAAGPVGAALVAGNTVVMKPSEIGARCGHLTYDVLVEAGVPRGVINLVTGPGETAGATLVDDARVGGLTFTGSSAVGTSILHAFSAHGPRPAICEMGGKNPVIVTATADLDLAVEGTARSAFGFAGQKCSAASRAYVHESLVDEFCRRLVARAAAIALVGPLDRDGYLSPVIDDDALARYEAMVASAGEHGTVLCGGARLTDGDLGRGNFVAPTVVRVPDDHPIWRTELFVPLIAVRPVATLDEALDRANALPFGLTAGLFAGDQAEIDRFLAAIEAGVVYVNRPAGATTGAWPGVQPFGGWKGSGTTGKSGGGPYYLQQYLREQSRTIVG